MANGSMRRRGRDAWELRVYVGTDPDTRRQRWLTKTVHGSARYAHGQLHELAQEAGRAKLRAGTLSDLLERWFEVASPGWAASTASHTRTVIECYLKAHLGHLPVNKIATEDIDDLYAYLLRLGGEHHQPLAPGSVARVHGVLHRALAQAVRWDWVLVNPVSAATPPRVPPADIRPPSPAQVAALLEWTRQIKPALFCFLSLAACTGARRSQLLAVRWRDVDWDRGALAFTRGLVVGPKGLELRATKTHRTYRVELDPETLGALMEHRSRAEARLARSWEPTFRAMPSCSVAVRTGESRGFRTGRRRSSSAPGVPPGSPLSGSMTFVTSWRPRCSPRACRSSRSRNGSATRGSPPR